MLLRTIKFQAKLLSFLTQTFINKVETVTARYLQVGNVTDAEVGPTEACAVDFGNSQRQG